jgi:HAD superfamily hydrolase (TIGR01450 family)
VKDFTDRFDHYLIDLWGVLWDGESVYQGAIDFCHRLIDEGKNIHFLSNTAEFPVEDLVGRFHDAGLTEVNEGHIITSGDAMAPWLRDEGLAGKPVYVFGGEGNWENVRRAGAKPIELPDDPMTMSTSAESNCLVVGGVHRFTWRRMEQVVTAVKLGTLTVLDPNPDLIVVAQSGEITLPAGMITRIIETALPQARIVRLGKPFPFIYEYAFERIGIGNGQDRSRVVMIGDSLDTDIRGAHNAGIASLLLGQGVHMGQSAETIRGMAVDKGIYPDYFTPRLAPDDDIQAVDWRAETDD